MTPTRAIPMPKNSDGSGIRSSGFWNLEKHMSIIKKNWYNNIG